MKLNTIVTGIALSGVALFAQQKPAPASPGVSPAPVRAGIPTNAPPRMAQEQLTPEQRKAIEEATVSLREEQSKISTQQVPLRQALRALENADPIDEAAIRAKAAELSKFDVELAVVRAKRAKAIRGVIGKEQYDRMYNRPPMQRPLGQGTNTVIRPGGPTPAPK